jgi:predicted AAA+ superfamily ATPase
MKSGGQAGNKLEILQFDWMISPVITRHGYLNEVRTGLGRGPVVALIGPRQCGKKTNLARQLMGTGEAGYF